MNPGQTYRHYRNKHTYVVVCLPVNPNTDEEFVVYRRPKGERLYVRHRAEFDRKFAPTSDDMEAAALTRETGEAVFPPDESEALRDMVKPEYDFDRLEVTAEPSFDTDGVRITVTGNDGALADKEVGRLTYESYVVPLIRDRDAAGLIRFLRKQT